MPKKKLKPRPAATTPDCDQCSDTLGKTKNCQTCQEYLAARGGDLPPAPPLPDEQAARVAGAAPGAVKDPRARPVRLSPEETAAAHAAGGVEIEFNPGKRDAIGYAVFGHAAEGVRRRPLSAIPAAADGATPSLYIGDCARCPGPVTKARAAYIDEGPEGQSKALIHDSCRRPEDTYDGQPIEAPPPAQGEALQLGAEEPAAGDVACATAPLGSMLPSLRQHFKPVPGNPSLLTEDELAALVDQRVGKELRRVAHDALPELARENLRLLLVSALPLRDLDVVGLSVDDLPAAVGKAAEVIKAMKGHLSLAEDAIGLQPAFERHLLNQAEPDSPQLKLPLESGAAGEPVGKFAETGNEVRCALCDLSFVKGLPEDDPRRAVWHHHEDVAEGAPAKVRMHRECSDATHAAAADVAREAAAPNAPGLVCEAPRVGGVGICGHELEPQHQHGDALDLACEACGARWRFHEGKLTALVREGVELPPAPVAPPPPEGA